MTVIDTHHNNISPDGYSWWDGKDYNKYTIHTEIILHVPTNSTLSV